MKWNADLLSRAGCGYLCALGLQLFLLDLLGISGHFPWPNTALFCLLCFAVLILATIAIRYVLYGLWAAACVIAVLFAFRDVRSGFFSASSRFGAWLWPFLSGSGSDRPQFETIFYIALLIAVSLVCYAAACLPGNTAAAFTAIAAPVFFLSFYTRRDPAYPLLTPAVFGIALLFAFTSKNRKEEARDESSRHTGFWQTLLALIPLTAGMLVAGSLILSGHPADGLRSEKVAESTDDVFSFIRVPLPDSAGRSYFNLGWIGLYPLHEQLGGPVSVGDDDVLEVTASSDFLLRAATYNVYRGTYWSSSNSILSSRFHSDAFTKSTEDDFDMNRPSKTLIPENLRNAVLEEEKAEVKNLSPMTGGTIFTADHLTGVSYDGADVFCNRSGELFLKNALPVGDSYTVTFSHFRTDSQTYREDLLALESYIIGHPEAGDSARKTLAVTEEYLDVDVPQSVTDYGLSITSGAVTPLEKVFAIRSELLANYMYYLDVTVPPQNSDFVEHFMETRTGYCTYFATAMAVLARVSGIPSRYVEGFVVDVPSGGTLDFTSSVWVDGEHADISSLSAPEEATVAVTEKNAHAWCEVYINGIGWIPVDATAGPSGSGLALTEEHQPTFIVTPAPSGTPVPTGAPYPTGPASDGTPSDTENGTPGIGTVGNILKVLAGILGAAGLAAAGSFLAFAALCRKKMLSLAPFETLAAARSPEDTASLLWNLALSQLSLISVRIGEPESPSDFALRVRDIPVYITGCHKDTYCFDISVPAGLREKWVYGNRPPSEEELRIAFDSCRTLVGQVRGAHISRGYYLLHILGFAANVLRGMR